MDTGRRVTRAQRRASAAAGLQEELVELPTATPSKLRSAMKGNRRASRAPLAEFSINEQESAGEQVQVQLAVPKVTIEQQPAAEDSQLKTPIKQQETSDSTSTAPIATCCPEDASTPPAASEVNAGAEDPTAAVEAPVMSLTTQQSDDPVLQAIAESPVINSGAAEIEPAASSVMTPAAVSPHSSAASADTMSDVERLLASPTVRLTPETIAKMARVAEAAMATPESDRWEIDALSDSTKDADSMTVEIGDVPVAEQPAVVPPPEQPAIAPPASVVKSKVTVSDSFEPRSIRQLKKDIQAAYAKKQAATPLPGNNDSDASDCESYYPAKTSQTCAATRSLDAALSDAMGGLSIAPMDGCPVAPLRGVPVAQGRHLRFTDEGSAVDSPGAGRVQLRGLPAAAGQHMRFDD